jgi:hypothetical protein
MPGVESLEVEQQSLVVVHDPRTGKIIHMHYVETMKGGKHPDKKTLEKDALEQLSAAQPGISSDSKLSLLHADPASVQPRTAYKVDTKKSALVEVKKRKSRA